MTKFADDHIWSDPDDQGKRRLLAAPGDPIPEDDETMAGYQEKVDTRAFTADAAAVNEEAPPATSEQVSLAADVPYADPPDAKQVAKSRAKARKQSTVEDKADTGPKASKSSSSKES